MLRFTLQTSILLIARKVYAALLGTFRQVPHLKPKQSLAPLWVALVVIQPDIKQAAMYELKTFKQNLVMVKAETEEHEKHYLQQKKLLIDRLLFSLDNHYKKGPLDEFFIRELKQISQREGSAEANEQREYTKALLDMMEKNQESGRRPMQIIIEFLSRPLGLKTVSAHAYLKANEYSNQARGESAREIEVEDIALDGVDRLNEELNQSPEQEQSNDTPR